MVKKLSFIALCLSLFLFSACVSKKEYVALETKSNQTQAQLEQEIRDLQGQVSKLTAEKNRHLDTIEGLKTELEKRKAVGGRKEEKEEKEEKEKRRLKKIMKR